MHAVIRKYFASQGVMGRGATQVEHLARTMCETPGFVAWYFLRTRDGLTTITVTENERGPTSRWDARPIESGRTCNRAPR
jgi:hypothetical protein